MKKEIKDSLVQYTVTKIICSKKTLVSTCKNTNYLKKNSLFKNFSPKF